MEHCKYPILQRDNDLYQSYLGVVKSHLDNNRPLNRRAMIREAIERGRPAFPFTLDTALRVVFSLDNHRRTDHDGSRLTSIWGDFYDKVCAARRRHPRWSTKLAVSHVLCNERANGFFLSERYAQRIISKMERHHATTA